MPADTRTVPVPLTMHLFSTAPDRMVGVCDRCGRWYLIDLTPGTEEAVMVLLPDGGYFRDALTRRPA